MAGLDPAIHVFLSGGTKDVDARHKAGHDEFVAPRTFAAWHPIQFSNNHRRHCERSEAIHRAAC
jgi:hypothetical protein